MEDEAKRLAIDRAIAKVLTIDLRELEHAAWSLEFFAEDGGSARKVRDAASFIRLLKDAHQSKGPAR